MPGSVQGMQAANVSKSKTGHDLLVPTNAGLVVIPHANTKATYTIHPGSDVNGLTLGTTDGANFVAMANFGNTQEVYQFTVNGLPVTKLGQATQTVRH